MKTKYEIHHYYSEALNIYSKGYNVYILHSNGTAFNITIPSTFLDRITAKFRILSRLFRTDKCNVFVINEEDLTLLIIRRGIVYYFKKGAGLIEKLQLKNCRNLMHIDICRLPNGVICFGEYGNNKERFPVPIYCSRDEGQNWEVAYEFSMGAIKHIHNLKYDNYTDTIWCCTGDLVGECKLVIFDLQFNKLKEIGDGSQNYRTCDLIFQKDSVIWLMDSHIETSYVVKLNRKSELIEILSPLPGPVWYCTRLLNGQHIAATTVEHGYSMKHKKAHLLISSNDAETWTSIKSFDKDYYYPLDFFKYGAIGFPIGQQKKEKFSCFGEALIDFDGVTITIET